VWTRPLNRPLPLCSSIMSWMKLDGAGAGVSVLIWCLRLWFSYLARRTALSGRLRHIREELETAEKPHTLPQLRRCLPMHHSAPQVRLAFSLAPVGSVPVPKIGAALLQLRVCRVRARYTRCHPANLHSNNPRKVRPWPFRDFATADRVLDRP